MHSFNPEALLYKNREPPSLRLDTVAIKFALEVAHFRSLAHAKIQAILKGDVFCQFFSWIHGRPLKWLEKRSARRIRNGQGEKTKRLT
jgi:hypothetical protein